MRGVICLCDDVNGKNKQGDEDMATLNLTNYYAIGEREAKLIVDTPKTVVNKPSYADRFHLTPAESQKRAIDVLNKWK